LHSKEYEDARGEFWNCIRMIPVTLGFSLILAFTEWRPRMKAALIKEAEQNQ